MRALDVFGFKHNLTGPSDHLVDASDGTSELMGSSGIYHNIFICVLIRDESFRFGSILFHFIPIASGTLCYHDGTATGPPRFLQGYCRTVHCSYCGWAGPSTT